MELQWPLILFTTLTAWGCGVLGGAGALALKGAGKKSQQLLAILSCVLLAAGGIAVFFHLQHWERIFNGFGHITSGITQELIAIVAFVAVAVAYFAMARKSDDGGTLPKGMAWVAVAISVILAAVCAHSYMMPARPAWDSVLEVLSIVGAACLLGPATCAVVLAAKGEDAGECGLPAVAGSAIGAVCTAAYAAFIQLSAGAFSQVGYYFDPTHPTKAVADAAATVGDQAPLLWLGAVVVGAVVPLVCCVMARKKGDAASWKLFGGVAVVAALVGAVCLRVAFYNVGLSVFMFCGFIKSIPLDIEEAAMIDGCNPLQTFFGVVMPILKPTAITVAILNAMWIWNDYLLPYLVIGLSTNYKTIPVVVQYLVGSYGAKDLGAMMALLVLSVIPIIVFYLTCQKYIIEGVVAGAVKG